VQDFRDFNLQPKHIYIYPFDDLHIDMICHACSEHNHLIAELVLINSISGIIGCQAGGSIMVSIPSTQQAQTPTLQWKSMNATLC
jgi:hypothetical protein